MRPVPRHHTNPRALMPRGRRRVRTAAPSEHGYRGFGFAGRRSLVTRIDWRHERHQDQNPRAFDRSRNRSRAAAGSGKGAAQEQSRAGDVARHYSTCPQRVDLLDPIRQEGRDAGPPDHVGLRKPRGRQEAAVLLAGMQAPLIANHAGRAIARHLHTRSLRANNHNGTHR